MSQLSYATPSEDWQDFVSWDEEEIYDSLIHSDSLDELPGDNLVSKYYMSESVDSEQPYLVSAPPSLANGLPSLESTVSTPPSILEESYSSAHLYDTSPSFDTTTTSPLVGYEDRRYFGSFDASDCHFPPTYSEEPLILDTRYDRIPENTSVIGSFESPTETVFNPFVAGTSHSFSGLDVRASQMLNVGNWADQPQIIEPIAEADMYHKHPALATNIEQPQVITQRKRKRGVFAEPRDHFAGTSLDSSAQRLPAQKSRPLSTQAIINSARAAEDKLYRDLVQTLEQDESLQLLHEHAFALMGAEHFITRYSRILRSVYSTLPDGARSSSNIFRISQQQSVPRWLRLAKRIAARLQMAGTQNSEVHKVDTFVPPTASALRSVTTKAVSALSPAAGLSGRIPRMKLALGFLVLPQSLLEIILSGSTGLVRVNSVNCESYTNRIKAAVEGLTKLEWDWWPLSPRIPDVSPGQCRLEWMLGGSPLYQIISSKDAQIIEAILPLLRPHSDYCSCCRPTPHRRYWSTIRMCVFGIFTSYWHKQASNTPSSRTGNSKASERYTPTGASTTSPTPSEPQNGSAPVSDAVSGNDHNALPQTQSQVSNASVSQSPITSHRILFAIQGSKWSLDLEQIHVSSLLTDPEFFRDLIMRYRKHRSWIKYIMSPFRFRFCKFVKFEKFDIERILSQGEDLPDYPGVEQDYEYAPRPGTNPMIPRKTFAVCLKVCDAQCKWPLINPWHDCIRLPCRPYRLRCIPKKKTEFDVQSDDIGTVAWGLEAGYAISFAYVAVYHLVPLLAALGFWIYWLVRFPGDWQNAAVPILTVLAMFAVLWVPFGRHVNPA